MSDEGLEAIIREGIEKIEALKAESEESPKMLTTNGNNRERPPQHRAADQRNELPPPHSNHSTNANKTR